MEEVFNRGELRRCERLVADDFYNHEAPNSLGPEGFKSSAKWLRGAFPDYHAELHEVVVEGALFVARLVVSGTHRGSFMGLPPTGGLFRCSTCTCIESRMPRSPNTGPAETTWASSPSWV